MSKQWLYRYAINCVVGCKLSDEEFEAMREMHDCMTTAFFSRTGKVYKHGDVLDDNEDEYLYKVAMDRIVGHKLDVDEFAAYTLLISDYDTAKYIDSVEERGAA